MDMLK